MAEKSIVRSNIGATSDDVLAAHIQLRRPTQLWSIIINRYQLAYN